MWKNLAPNLIRQRLIIEGTTEKIVDIYTCKPFSVNEVIKFTKKYFKALDIVWKEIEV